MSDTCTDDTATEITRAEAECDIALLQSHFINKIPTAGEPQEVITEWVRRAERIAFLRSSAILARSLAIAHAEDRQNERGVGLAWEEIGFMLGDGGEDEDWWTVFEYRVISLRDWLGAIHAPMDEEDE